MVCAFLDINWSLFTTIIVGVAAITLSVIFFVKTSQLNTKTNSTLDELRKNVTKLESLYNNYIEKILDKFIEDHDIHRDKALQDKEVDAKKSQEVKK